MSANHFFSFLMGAAAGAAVAWLLTSEQGKETAAELKAKASAGLDQLENAVEDFKAKAEQKAKAAAETVEEVIGKK